VLRLFPALVLARVKDALLLALAPRFRQDAHFLENAVVNIVGEIALTPRLALPGGAEENRAALRMLCREAEITPRYLAAFTRETIVHRGDFRAVLTAGAGWEAYIAFLDAAWEQSEAEGGAGDEE